MIAVRKLMTLTPLHRARKAAQVLGHTEADYRQGLTSAGAWVAELGSAFAADESLGPELRALAAEASGEAGRMALSSPEAGTRLVNRLRRGLEAHAGVSPADWDLREPLGLILAQGARRVFPGVRAYLEDLRSPFNVGSVFRSADAFGVAEIVLSGFTADPRHQRAERSAMGAVDIVPWRRGGLEALAEPGEAFALELRGEPIDTFAFPERGIVVVGSEELGVSPEAMALCSRTVSIPMLGAKGSLNAGVAFGVLMDAWRRSLASRGVEPVRA
ncbi:MAG: TrmH family RNA methyltransferase [Spirochaetes bacterium]|nr:TrmH family RNA methyltransferase [Spirochaetota bacterium]MBU1081093.1 TrmH family RNA methyltransferase [Spirochaetota bacterium]